MMSVNYVASVFLIVLGLYTILTKKNLIKIVLGMGIVDYGVNLLIVSVGAAWYVTEQKRRRRRRRNKKRKSAVKAHK